MSELGISSLFLVHHHVPSDEAKMETILEIQAVSPPSRWSWFMEDEVVAGPVNLTFSSAH